MTEEQACQQAAELLATAKHGMLATLQADQMPFSSLVAVSAVPGGLIVHASALARHFKYIVSHGKVSLLLMDPPAWQRQEIMIASRLSLSGELTMAPAESKDSFRKSFLAGHPDAAAYVDFADFRFFYLSISDAYLVAGFGNIFNLDPKSVVAEADNH